MSTKNHSILGERIDYNNLNARQQESYNLQKASSIFAEYGYLVMKLSDDWNGPDFIALKFGLEFGKDNYLKVQLKGRFGFWKKYLGKNLFICFCDQDSKNWYLYPHDELCEIIMKKHVDSISWKDKGEYHFPTISEDDKEILSKYKITEEIQKEILEDNQKDFSSDTDLIEPSHQTTININRICVPLYKKDGEKIQDFVKRTLRLLFNNYLLPEDEINNMLNKKYCSKTFAISYPIIHHDKTKFIDGEGNRRCWSKKIIGNKYYACSQWQKHREKIYSKKISEWIKKIGEINEKHWH
jgi:uncharacterized protein (DUF4415 family)